MGVLSAIDGVLEMEYVGAFDLPGRVLAKDVFLGRSLPGFDRWTQGVVLNEAR